MRDHGEFPMVVLLSAPVKNGMNDENGHVIEYSLKLDSKPGIHCICCGICQGRIPSEQGRAVRLQDRVFDIAPAYPSAADGAGRAQKAFALNFAFNYVWKIHAGNLDNGKTT